MQLYYSYLILIIQSSQPFIITLKIEMIHMCWLHTSQHSKKGNNLARYKATIAPPSCPWSPLSNYTFWYAYPVLALEL